MNTEKPHPSPIHRQSMHIISNQNNTNKKQKLNRRNSVNQQSLSNLICIKRHIISNNNVNISPQMLSKRLSLTHQPNIICKYH